MNLILTMAGKYTRFRLFGNKIPKYLLPLGTETILAQVIKNYLTSAPNCNIYLIANRNDQIFFPIVRSIMNKYNICSKNLIYIDDTSSQLETAITSKNLLHKSQHIKPIAFANIDTILINRTSFFSNLQSANYDQGILDTFNGESKQYSFARIDQSNKVLDVVDKNVVSNNACSGLYGFGSFSEMIKIGDELLKEKPGANFTNIYQKYISMGYEVQSNKTDDSSKTIVLGTPEEYVINIHRFK